MRILKYIFIECAVIIIFFLTIELAGRFYFYVKHGYSFKESFLYDNDDTLVYKINEHYRGPHGKYSHGFRKDYFEENKKDKFRIVCLGGSTTFGHSQFDNPKVWPEILERRLNHGGGNKYEVLNGGLPGYGSSNLLAKLEKGRILKLKPDMLIMFEGWNLVGCVKSKYSWVPDNIYSTDQPVLKRMNNFLIDNSIIYLKMRQALLKVARSNGDQFAEFEKVYQGEFRVFKDNIKKSIKICRDNQITPVLIKYPTKDYSYKRYLDTIKVIEEIAQETDTILIDCASYFKYMEDKERESYFVDIVHFSDRGNEKIAELIHESLINRKLIVYGNDGSS